MYLVSLTSNLVTRSAILGKSYSNASARSTNIYFHSLSKGTHQGLLSNALLRRSPQHLLQKNSTSLYTKSNKKILPFNNSRLAWLSFKRTFGGMASGVTGGKIKMSNREIFAKFYEFIWPKDNKAIKFRVIVALSLLIGAKLLNVAVPFVFKEIIDLLNSAGLKDFGNSTKDKLLVSVIALVIGYGAARAGSSLMGELRNAVFARVAQNSVTQLATQVFRHLHNLDLNFHLNRQTGALSKSIDRGTRGISFVLSALVFNVVPTIVEVGLVSGILWSKFGLGYALCSVGCIAGYTAFTFAITQWRTKFRIDMNKAENDSGNKAIDSLINFETVKYFDNTEYEVKRYQESLKNYERNAIKTSTSLAVLNFGQNAIFSTGLVAIMLMASHGVVGGTMTVGDLVMCNALLFQLSMPLNFLGTVYREVINLPQS
jgi:ATP-binding cassette subfamily B (MDR/TAP) protein 7